MQRLLLIGTQDWTILQHALRGAGYEFTCAAPDAMTLIETFEMFRPDALLLELGDDTLLLQHVRRLLRAELNQHPIPILALARRAHLRPAQLVVGVDDFLLPPYDADELLARIQMMLWRVKRVNAQNCVQAGGLTVDLGGRSVKADGKPVSLTPREYQLLLFLITHRDRAFTREALLAQVWGYDFEGEARVVDATIKRVRSKLPAPYCDLVDTVRGIGYRFHLPV